MKKKGSLEGKNFTQFVIIENDKNQIMQIYYNFTEFVLIIVQYAKLNFELFIKKKINKN